jgi:GNAT superfamily N-acetyltransferase
MVDVHLALPSPSLYASLLSEVGWDVPPPTVMKKALAGTQQAACVFDGGKVVGMGRLVADGGEYWFLVDVVVTPSHQGKGVGSAIVAALEAEVARRSPGSFLFLHCAPEMAGFFERLGYEQSPGSLMSKQVL